MTTLYDSRGRDIYEEREKELQKTLGPLYNLVIYLENTSAYTGTLLNEFGVSYAKKKVMVKL